MSHHNAARTSPLADKLTDDPSTNKSAQSTVTCVYQAVLGGQWRYITLFWAKNLMNQSFSITIDDLEGDQLSSCKVDLKPWQFWSKKGTKHCEVDSNKLEIHWDLRAAKFSGSPEPCSDYYLTIVSEEEIVLVLGDNKKKAYKKAKGKPHAAVEVHMLYKKENVFAKKSFSARARFDHRRRENDIVVESSTTGAKDPEMWISVDGIVLIHVRNLQWKFRGNQTVVVHKQPVQVLWDVHDWLFSGLGTGRGLFIFKPGVAEGESEGGGSSISGGGGGGGSSVSGSGSSAGDGESEDSSGIRYYSPVTSPEFCLFLHAFKME